MLFPTRPGKLWLSSGRLTMYSWYISYPYCIGLQWVLVLFNILNNISVYFLVWIFYFYHYVFVLKHRIKIPQMLMAVYQECRKWGNWDSEIKLQSLIDRTGSCLWVLLVCLMVCIKFHKGIDVFGHLVTFNVKFLCHLFGGWRRERPNMILDIVKSARLTALKTST